MNRSGKQENWKKTGVYVKLKVIFLRIRYTQSATLKDSHKDSFSFKNYLLDPH